MYFDWKTVTRTRSYAWSWQHRRARSANARRFKSACRHGGDARSAEAVEATLLQECAATTRRTRHQAGHARKGLSFARELFAPPCSVPPRPCLTAWSGEQYAVYKALRQHQSVLLSWLELSVLEKEFSLFDWQCS